jgi:hypothetical protein
MRRSLYCVVAAMLFIVPVSAAMAQRTKAQLNTEITSSFPDQNVGSITPAGLRNTTLDIVNSIMPTAPVVSGDLVCFDGTTGLLKDCGTNPPFSFGAVTIISNSTNALSVGPNGTTNPTFNVDASVASAATGINIKGNAAGTSPVLSTISPNTNENLTLSAKGSGSVVIQSTGATTITSTTTPVLSLVPPSGLSGGVLSDGTSLGFSQPGTSIWAKINLSTGEFDALSSVASTSKTTGSITAAGGLGVAGNVYIGGTLSLSGQGVPTIASGACGTGTNGVITSGTNQAGLVTIGAVATTTCTISFSATLPTAPAACLISPANAAAAATGTTVARVSSISASNWVITGTALANAAYYFHCI